MPRSASPPARIPRALAALGAGLALTLVAAPAYAHDELKSTLPADGTSVATAPGQVVLTFEEPPVELGLQVVVTGPDGPVSSGTARIDG
ncbi:MAG TPA: copper resistance protein CopC, partial [Friedmanniella sp.]